MTDPLCTATLGTVDVTDAEIIASINAMRATVLAAKQAAREECDCDLRKDHCRAIREAAQEVQA